MGKHKQLTLLFLYVAQAIPMSFFSSVVPVILREEQFSLESIGLLQFIKFPWILKLFWAPFVDNRTTTLNDYKRWIIRSELFYAAAIGLIALLQLQTNFALITLLMVVAITASATQDIATDALSIRMMDTKTHSLGAGMQSMGGFLGALIGGGLLLIIYQRLGWNSLLWGLAGFVLLALIPLLLYKQPLRESDTDKRTRKITLGSLISFFGRRGTGKQVLFLILYYSGIIASLAMLRPYLVDLGYSKETIGWLLGVGGTSIAAACSFLTGRLIRRYNRHTIGLIVSCFILLSMIYISWVSVVYPNDPFFIHSAIAFIWGAYGMGSVVVYTTAMSLARPGSEGTDFTLQTVLVQLVGMVLAGLSGWIAGQFSYSFLFGAGAFLSLTALLYNGFIYRNK